MFIYLKRSIAKDCSEDGRGEEGDDGQQDCHAGCDSDSGNDFIVEDTQGHPTPDCILHSSCAYFVCNPELGVPSEDILSINGNKKLY